MRAILEALFAREKTGQGASLAISLFDATAEWMAVPLMYFEGTGIAPPGSASVHPRSHLRRVLTADGKAIIFSVQNEREWLRLCEAVLGRPDLRRSALCRQCAAGRQSRGARRDRRRALCRPDARGTGRAVGRGGDRLWPAQRRGGPRGSPALTANRNPDPGGSVGLPGAAGPAWLFHAPSGPRIGCSQPRHPARIFALIRYPGYPAHRAATRNCALHAKGLGNGLSTAKSSRKEFFANAFLRLICQ